MLFDLRQGSRQEEVISFLKTQTNKKDKTIFTTTKHPFVYLFFFFRKNIISLSYFIFSSKIILYAFSNLRVLHFLFFLKRKNFKISKYKSAYSQVQLSGLISIAKWTNHRKFETLHDCRREICFWLIYVCLVFNACFLSFSLQRKKRNKN